MPVSECELCGREIDVAKKAKIEGTVLEVCNNCSALGAELLSPKQPTASRNLPSFIQPSETLTENYPTLVRNARQKTGLTIEQLALKISEKDFVVRRVEEGRLKPDPELARKFEKFLGIRLFVKTEETETNLLEDLDSSGQKTKGTKGPNEAQNDKLTLGDFIKIKKK